MLSSAICSDKPVAAPPTFVVALERPDLCLHLLNRQLQLLLPLLDRLDLLREPVQLGLRHLRPRQGDPGQILLALAQSHARLVLQLRDALGELVSLNLEALLRRQDVSDAAARLLQRVELLLIREVESLRRILSLVDGRAHLLLENVGHAAQDAHDAPPEGKRGLDLRPRF
jgi:hypothetical protein